MNDQRNITINSFQAGENNFNPHSSLKDDIVSNIYQKININLKIKILEFLIFNNNNIDSNDYDPMSNYNDMMATPNQNQLDFMNNNWNNLQK